MAGVSFIEDVLVDGTEIHLEAEGSLFGESEGLLHFQLRADADCVSSFLRVLQFAGSLFI